MFWFNLGTRYNQVISRGCHDIIKRFELLTMTSEVTGWNWKMVKPRKDWKGGNNLPTRQAQCSSTGKKLKTLIQEYVDRPRSHLLCDTNVTRSWHKSLCVTPESNNCPKQQQQKGSDGSGKRTAAIFLDLNEYVKPVSGVYWPLYSDALAKRGLSQIQAVYEESSGKEVLT